MIYRDCGNAYPAREKIREVSGCNIHTWARKITHHNVLEVETGTTGYKGGNSSYGGRTYFRLNDLGGTDIKVNILRHESQGYLKGVEIMLGGDAELRTFIEALKWTVDVLEDTIKEQR